jgi:hypothetical protein
VSTLKRFTSLPPAPLNSGNAHGKGELRRSVDPREEAGFFTASVLGVFVMLRAKAPPTVVESTARVAIEHLEALRTPTGT